MPIFMPIPPLIVFYTNDRMPAFTIGEPCGCIYWRACCSVAIPQCEMPVVEIAACYEAIEAGVIKGSAVFLCAVKPYHKPAVMVICGQVMWWSLVTVAIMRALFQGLPMVLMKSEKPSVKKLRQGAHQIKIFVSGGISSPTDPIWSAAIYRRRNPCRCL